MKNLFSFIAGLCVVFAFSFSRQSEVKKSLAEVEQMEGIYVFVDSRPVREFDHLGTAKIGVSFGSPQYAQLRDRLISKVKKEFPNADGVILHFSAGGVDKADAIKFK
jgi:hypothetical protein